ncbi:hypothetical protein F5051DRAFT_431758 [Lentinula edodes]|nr:hypothetical protein F5051DRAFT_431758 [Lentinula edodes]
MPASMKMHHSPLQCQLQSMQWRHRVWTCIANHYLSLCYIIQDFDVNGQWWSEVGVHAHVSGEGVFSKVWGALVQMGVMKTFKYCYLGVEMVYMNVTSMLQAGGKKEFNNVGRSSNNIICRFCLGAKPRAGGQHTAKRGSKARSI